MRNHLTLLFAASIILMLSLPIAHAEQQGKEWVVVLDDPRPERLKGWQRNGYSGDGHYNSALELKRSAQRLAKKHDLAVRAEWFIESLGVYCLITLLNGDQQTTLDRLRSEKNVKAVQRSNTFELLQDKARVEMKPNAVELTLGRESELRLPTSVNGQGVIIALVDSAVDQTHPDIINHITENVDLVNDASKVSTGEAHGTAVAGVMVADQNSDFGVTGVAAGAELKAYRGCWENVYDRPSSSSANCDTLSLARALDAVAVDSDADILNLSLSGPKDELLDQIIHQILSQGVTVVTAYDPTRSATNRFPSISPGVIAVRSDSLNQDHAQIFSAPGKKIVAAPKARAAFIQGHSIAAAQVSGVLALCAQGEKKQKKKICTPDLFERLNKIDNNNLHGLLSELKSQLN